MTSPLTPPPPPHGRPAQPSRSGEAERQPWQPPASGAEATGPTGATGTVYGPDGQDGQDGPGMKTEVREAAVITVAVALGGVLMGLLWLWLAPRVPLVGDVTGNSWVVYLKDSEGEQAIGVDGTFTLLALAFGVLSAVAVFLVRRRGGVPLVVALCVGGLLGAVLAWRLGVWLGPQQDVIAHAQAVGKGVTFAAPLKLGAKGALLAWPLTALVVHLGITALFGPRDPEGYGESVPA
ncbi:AAA family ATPase [Streptomyces sp. NPDC006393]|uniref:AAA family ATPase n=1 Tax=Streptomyces sp. NPDC006393 TaxID=3156763 RepID=UPI0033F8C38D